MADGFKLHLFQNRHFADVTFIVDGKELEAHKCVLAESCDYFKQLFDEIKGHRILTEGISFKPFNEVINFCYLGKIDITNWDYEEKMLLNYLAIKYKFKPLIELVKKELEKPSDILVTVETLNELYRKRSPEEIRLWLENNVSSILNYEDCHKYSKDLIVLIVDTLNKIYDKISDKFKLQLMQKKVLNWLFRWRDSPNRTEEDVKSIYLYIQCPSVLWLYFKDPMEITLGKTVQLTPKEFKAMLHFWRDRNVDTAGWTCEEILQLLVLANAYNFGSFSDALENILGTQYLEPASLVAIHDKALELNSMKMQQIIANYINNNAMNIFSSAEFTNYPACVVGFIVDNLKDHVMDTKTKTVMLTYIRKWMASKTEEEVKAVFTKIHWNDFAREEVADFFENLLYDDNTKDITFLFDNQAIKAHKFVLTYSCDHFIQLLNENERNTIDMDPTSFKVFKEMVNYCYLEQIDFTNWDYAEKKYLHNLATEYKYQSLMELVKNELEKPSEVNFTVETLNELYKKRPLRETRQWVEENMLDIMKNEDCNHYSKDLVVFIMKTFYNMYLTSNDRRGLKKSKSILHSWLFNWINLSTGKEDYSVLEKIRWPLVPSEQRPIIKAFLKIIQRPNERLDQSEQPEFSGTKRKHE